MDQTNQKRIIETNHNLSSLVVDNSEFELITDFIAFVRGRERGIFTAEIITNASKRCVLLDFHDKKKIDLNLIKEYNIDK